MLCCTTLPVHAEDRSAEQPAPAPTSSQAKDLLRTGLECIEAGRHEAARVILLEALDLQPSYDVYGALGRAELELRRYRDAAEHLDRSIRNFPQGEDREVLSEMQEGLTLARRYVATVRVVVRPPGFEVTVDGRNFGPSPFAGDVFLDRGSHEVEARSLDEIATRQVEVEAGDTYEVELQVRAPAMAALAPPVTEPTPREPADNRSLIPVVIGGSVAAIGVGMLIGFGMAAGSDDNELERLIRENGDSGCLGRATASCAAQRQTAESYDRNLDLATAGLVIAGAAAVGTIVYWYWPIDTTNETEARRGRARFVARAGFGSGGARIHLGADF